MGGTVGDRIGWSKVFFFLSFFLLGELGLVYGRKEEMKEGRKEGWVVYRKVQVPGGDAFA